MSIPAEVYLGGHLLLFRLAILCLAWDFVPPSEVEIFSFLAKAESGQAARLFASFSNFFRKKVIVLPCQGVFKPFVKGFHQ